MLAVSVQPRAREQGWVVTASILPHGSVVSPGTQGTQAHQDRVGSGTGVSLLCPAPGRVPGVPIQHPEHHHGVLGTAALLEVLMSLHLAHLA